MIDSYSFGSYIINGKEHKWDIKLINKNVFRWVGRNGHNIIIDDIRDLIAEKPEILIIGIGASGLINVSDKIKEFIKVRGIKLIIEKTGAACNEYNNALKSNKKVCAIMHGTC